MPSTIPHGIFLQHHSQYNQRRLTNLGTFRAYLEFYLRQHPGIAKNFSLMVRQLQPTSEGLPMEIYAFTNTTVWAEYENIQSDIMDHILAIIPEFGLKVGESAAKDEDLVRDIQAVAFELISCFGVNLSGE